MMTQIAQNYATPFRIERIQQYINYGDYYIGMARQLCLVAEQYSTTKTERIFMAYVEVVRSLEILAAMYSTKSHKPGDLSAKKRLLYKAFTSVISELEIQQTCFPDEGIQRDLLNGKALAEEFNS
jgi:hypothetical protein